MSDVSRLQPDSLLPLLYATDHVYGWGQGMRAITRAILAAPLTQSRRILEIGCGSGILLREVVGERPGTVAIGSDLHPLALAHATQPTKQHRLTHHSESADEPTVRFVQNDLHHLPFSDNLFDLVIALDVLDQAGVDLAAALLESRRVLHGDGYLLLRVSAYSWLHSAHDTAFQTAQRYDRGPLQSTVTAAGFAIERATYANMLLAPPVIGLRLWQRWMGQPNDTALYTNAFSNRVLALVLRCEARWLAHRNLPAGISLYLLARNTL